MYILSWNQKFLDYEIETGISLPLMVDLALRWNQKFLDYEIETGNTGLGVPFRTVVGIKSFSITRLKRMYYGFVGLRRNYTVADVGIKSFSITRLKRGISMSEYTVIAVGIKSFSITRLKHVIMAQPGMITRETIQAVGIKSFSITRLKRQFGSSGYGKIHRGWNQKFLDYEIETMPM